MLKITTIIVTVSLAIVANTLADNSRSLAEEILMITDTRNVLNQMVMQIKNMQEQQFSRMELTEIQQKEATEFIEKSTNFMLTEMNWEKMKEDYITIYTDVYTEKDLTDLLTFYKSPIGKKFVEQQPLLVQKSMEVGQKKLLKIIPKLQEMTADFMGKEKK